MALIKRYANKTSREIILERREVAELKKRVIQSKEEKTRSSNQLQADVKRFCDTIRRGFQENEAETQSLFELTERIGIKLDRTTRRMKGSLSI